MQYIVGEKTVLLLKFTALSLLQNDQIKKAIATFVMSQYKQNPAQYGRKMVSKKSCHKYVTSTFLNR